MKERITVQRLIQEGWIPVLTGTLSAAVILSLAHSAGMGYVAALLLMIVYFAVISANLVDAVWMVAVKRLLARLISRYRAFFFVTVPDNLRNHLRSLGVSLLRWSKRQSERLVGALNGHFHWRVSSIEAMLMGLMHSIDEWAHGRTHIQNRDP